MSLKEVSAFMLACITAACLSAEGVETQSISCQPVANVSSRLCLGLTDDGIRDSDIPQPVVLTSSKDKFLCAGQAPQFFLFSCTLYGNEAVWLFNEETVVSYQNDDNVTQIPTREDRSPYTLISVLELVENETIYGTSQCISTLTVQPLHLNERQPDLPFSVACLTHCQNQTLDSTVCQREQFAVAEVPMPPENLQYTTNQMAVNLKWDPPLNQDSYELEYYTVTLDGRQSRTSLCTSFDAMIEEGSYTVHVTATNSCGNESEPANMTIQIVKSPDLEATIADQKETITELRAGLGAGLGIIAVLFVIVIIVIAYLWCYRYI